VVNATAGKYLNTDLIISTVGEAWEIRKRTTRCDHKCCVATQKIQKNNFLTRPVLPVPIDALRVSLYLTELGRSYSWAKGEGRVVI